MSNPQNFKKGDLVRIGKLPKTMSHFVGEGQEALVDHSYFEKFGHLVSSHDYALVIVTGPERCWTAWYAEELLTLVTPRTVESIERVERMVQTRKYRDKPPHKEPVEDIWADGLKSLRWKVSPSTVRLVDPPGTFPPIQDYVLCARTKQNLKPPGGASGNND